MELKGKEGLIVALILVVAAILTPIEYAPVAFFILLGWAALNRASIRAALAATIIFALSMAVAGILLGFGFLHGLLTSFRAISIILPIYTYFSISSMQELVDTLEAFHVPKDFAFMFAIAVPYSRIMGRKAQAIGIAQRSRGSKSPWAFIMPLLDFVFVRARMLAISIESRGWSPEKKDNNKNIIC